MKKLFYILGLSLLMLTSCNRDVQQYSIKNCEFVRSEKVKGSMMVPKFGVLPNNKTYYYYNLTLENDSVVEYETTTENWIPEENHKIRIVNNDYTDPIIVYVVELF